MKTFCKTLPISTSLCKSQTSRQRIHKSNIIPLKQWVQPSSLDIPPSGGLWPPASPGRSIAWTLGLPLGAVGATTSRPSQLTSPHYPGALRSVMPKTGTDHPWVQAAF